MESFFLAETMKYLYLLFDPDSEIDILNKVRGIVPRGTCKQFLGIANDYLFHIPLQHVFNTEAHPLKIFQ